MGGEPLSLVIRDAPPADGRDVRERRFAYSSRGDRVPGRLWQPTGRPGFAHPLVLIAHGAGEAKDAPAVVAAAGFGCARGFAVASIDLPLHGERAEAKLSRLLLDDLRAGTDRVGLASDFFRQAGSDLIRAVAALAELPDVDAARIGFAGFGLGAVAGARALDAEPRVRAVALVGAGPEPSGPSDTAAARLSVPADGDESKAIFAFLAARLGDQPGPA